MPKQDKSAFLLRVDTGLPVDLKLSTRKFRDGWEFVHSSDVRVLGKRLKSRKLQLVVDAEPLLKGGLGETPTAATASALKLALRQVGESFNAARVRYLDLHKYPWFYLATVAVYPHAIKRDSSRVKINVGPRVA